MIRSPKSGKPTKQPLIERTNLVNDQNKPTAAEIKTELVELQYSAMRTGYLAAVLELSVDRTHCPHSPDELAAFRREHALMLAKRQAANAILREHLTPDVCQFLSDLVTFAYELGYNNAKAENAARYELSEIEYVLNARCAARIEKVMFDNTVDRLEATK